MLSSVQVDEAEISAAIDKFRAKLGPDVVRLRHNVGENMSGDVALFLRIVLTEEASRPGNIGRVGRRVRGLIFEELRSLENWGLFPYTSFRSEAELPTQTEPDWV